MIKNYKYILITALSILFVGCTNPKLDNSMKSVTKFDEGLKCKCTANIYNLVDAGIVTNVDTKNKTITVKHDNGITSIFKNVEQISPTLLFQKDKRILKGYVVGIANDKTTYEQI